MLRVVINLFWFACLADGVLSLLDELLSLNNGISPLAVSRSVFALILIVASLAMAVVVSISPRAPKRVLVPLILFVLWAEPCAAFPLSSLEIPHFMLWLSLLEVGIAAGIYIVFRQRQPAVWYLPFAVKEAPAFLWKHTILTAPAMMVAVVLIAVVSTLSGIADHIETMTGGYVRLRPSGIYLVERKFLSGDREVSLAGMVHVAREEFYSTVLPSADPMRPAVVLVEGVTDNQGLLGDGVLGYSKLARMFSISAQEESVFTSRVVQGLRRGGGERSQGESDLPIDHDLDGLAFKHADVDVEIFHPKTIAFIVSVMGLFHADDWQQVMHTLSDPTSPIADEDAQAQVMQDILYTRNEKLVSEISESLKEYNRVIVPWGAMHLPEIESWLRAHDFVQSGETERKAVGFW